MECDVVERELLGYLFGAKWDRRTHRGARMIVRKVGGFFFRIQVFLDSLRCLFCFLFVFLAYFVLFYLIFYEFMEGTEIRIFLRY
jgi:hypothetical protein